MLAGILEADQAILRDYLKKYFGGKKPEVIDHNCTAADLGYAAGRKLCEDGSLSFSIARDKKTADRILVNGAEAVAMGAIAGGCNFISSYPMSPSTGVLTFLASHDDTFNIVAEQAEDEIAAVNMAVAAWYAGARAMATTSGGGFALMGEGISLAGVLETPLVIHLAQRPGPGTGLPTRTEQGDLELALYAGHGEFPRVIYAPGTIEEAFLLSARAFNTADRFQVPVFVLTDQYTMDTYYDIPGFDLDATPVEKAHRGNENRVPALPDHGRWCVAAGSAGIRVEAWSPPTATNTTKMATLPRAWPCAPPRSTSGSAKWSLS